MAQSCLFAPKDLKISDEFLEDNDNEPVVLKILTEYIEKTNYGLCRGDIVGISGMYRNDFKYVWDGSKLVALSHQLDDYGHIPEDFVVTHNDFTPDWWKDVIDHNGIFHLDRSIQDTMKFQITGSPDDPIAQADVQIGTMLWRCQQDDISNWKDEKPAYEDVQFSMDMCEFPGLDDECMNSFFLFHKTDWQKRNDE